MSVAPATGTRPDSGTTATAGWSVEPLTATIGAVVHGVDVAGDLSDAEIAAIRSALIDHRVIFFRGQSVTPSQHVAFARRFGPLTPAHPLLGGLDDDHPEVLVLDSADYPLGVGTRTNGTSYNDRWHTDVTFSERPPTATILAAKVIPARGGDTLWADLIDAYATLSAPIRTMIDELVAVHDSSGTFARFRDDDPTGENNTRLRELRSVEHPVVRVHPESGERGLFVNETLLSGSSVSPRTRATRSWRCCTSTRSSRSESCGGGGARATSLSGTTGRPPTTPPLTTASSEG